MNSKEFGQYPVPYLRGWEWKETTCDSLLIKSNRINTLLPVCLGRSRHQTKHFLLDVGLARCLPKLGTTEQLLQTILTHLQILWRTSCKQCAPEAAISFIYFFIRGGGGGGGQRNS